MSSAYHILCLSHDPAICLDGDQDYTPNALSALAAAAGIASQDPHAGRPAFVEQLARHAHCDLLVGRYSSPLVDVACPGVRPHCPTGHRHDSDTWTRAGWLRLLHAAHQRGDDVARLGLPSCWTKQRVLRLGRELGIEPATAQATP